MTTAVLDDHLLRDVLADEVSQDLALVLARHTLATTNLYVYRLSRSVVAARGGRLTGSWPVEQRRSLGRSLLALPDAVDIVPMRELTYRMAELAEEHRLSTLGAEAVAAAEHLGASLFVWEGDDGPAIRAAARGVGARYRTVKR